jgi:hypothetical protein
VGYFGQVGNLSSVVLVASDYKRKAMLSTVLRSLQHGLDEISDQLRGGLIAPHDLRSTAHGDSQLKARVVLIGTSGEYDQVINGRARRLLKGHTHHRTAVSQF